MIKIKEEILTLTGNAQDINLGVEASIASINDLKQSKFIEKDKDLEALDQYTQQKVIWYMH